MGTQISALHRKRFEEIKKSLTVLGYKEHAFIKVELLFFEALQISKDYGADPQHNALLASLKIVQAGYYEKTREAFGKSSQRESHIRRFVIQLKKALTAQSYA